MKNIRENKPLFGAVTVALMAAVMCVISPWSVFLPGIPVAITAATFVVYLIGIVLGAKNGFLCILLYICIGAVGLPVFSGFSGGVAKIAGPSGGFLVGYLPCVYLCGFLFEKLKKIPEIIRVVTAMLAGTAGCYLPGVLWLSFSLKITVSAAVTIGVLPYLLTDMLKIAAAVFVALPLRKALLKLGYENGNNRQKYNKQPL